MGVIGAWTIDEGRSGIEQLPPQVYLAHSYYGKWALRLENMVIAAGSPAPTRLPPGMRCAPAKAVTRKLGVADVRARPDARLFRPASAGPGPLQGRRARAHQGDPPGNAYAPAALRARPPRHRSKRCAAVMCFPNSTAVGAGENPQWLYTVVFDGRELWGENTDPTLTVSIDAFEPYLEAA